MKEYIRWIFYGLMICFLAACEEDMEPMLLEKNIVQVMGRVTEFQDLDVTSRSLKSEDESEIKTMSMFLFDDDGKCIDFQHVNSSSPLFAIDRSVLNDKSDDKNVSKATIYILANVPLEKSSVEKEKTEWLGKNTTELMKRSLGVAGIDIPTNGFPMIGSMTDVNLEMNGTVTDLLEISMKHLYAKMVFNIRVNTIQSLEEFIPSFQMTGWEVHNVPKKVAFDNNVPNESTAYWEETFQRRNYVGQNPVSGVNTLSFSFYLPEHILKANQSVEYPTGIKDIEKQRFKPLRISKDTKAPYVKIKGAFSDHQGHKHNLSYDIYLGKDNFENFEIERNYQYNNDITIKGVTNTEHGDDGTVSVDFRVNVERSGFTVSVEREAMLDSHIEVRPVRVDIIEKKGVSQKVKLYLAKPNTPEVPVTSTNASYKWARMEVANEALNKTDYCSSGKRKYFTTSLLDELNSGDGNGITVTLTGDNCVWIYFDENTNVSKTGARKVLLRAEYYENDKLVSDESYYFQQHDLFPVIFTDTENQMEYRYDIEYYEEYLYNFDPNDQYNVTKEGMPWGPKTPISNEILAIQDVQSSWADNLQYIATAIKKAGGYYDFQNLYSGRKNTKKLVSEMDQLVLAQNVTPNSAAEHCYNKNKRNTDGTVNNEDYHWYLPAIGELQRIMSAAYIDFEMFQENRYWSSQTSYRIGHFKYELLWGWLGTIEGDYYYEDKDYARATYATYANGAYSYESSEVQGISKTWTGSVTNQTGNFTNEVPPTSRDTGNQLRDEVLRVRAVRNKYQRPLGVQTWTEIIE